MLRGGSSSSHNPNIYPLALLAATSILTYYERTGFTIAFTHVADAKGYPQDLKGRVMGCFYYPYAVSGFVGGTLSNAYGGWRVMWCANAAWIFLALVSPLHENWIVMLKVCRFTAGVAQGSVFPCMHSLLTGLSSKENRGAVVTTILSLIYTGAAVAMLVTPHVVAWGGPRAQLMAAFGAGCVWLVLALPLAMAEPVFPSSVVTRPRTGLAAMREVPWAVIFATPSVHAIMVASFGFHLVAVMLMSWTPTFISAILSTDLKSLSPIVKAGPWLFMSLVTSMAGRVSDSLATCYGIRNSRRALTCSGLVFTVPPLLLLAYTSTPTVAFMLVAVALCTAGASRGGFSINHLDIAPIYAGPVAAAMNFLGTLGSACATDLGGIILQQGVNDRGAWYELFAIVSSVCVGAAIIYFVFAQGDSVLFAENKHPATCFHHELAPPLSGVAVDDDDDFSSAESDGNFGTLQGTHGHVSPLPLRARDSEVAPLVRPRPAHSNDRARC